MDATTKSRSGRSKVFGCFKSVHYEPGSPSFSGDAAAAASRRIRLRRSFSAAAASRRIRLRRSFSAAVKAVLFETSLKKSRSENAKQVSHKLRNNLFSFSKSKKIMKKKNSPCMRIDPNQVFRSNSDHSSLFSSNSSSHKPSVSSSASSSSSHSRSESAHKINLSMSLDFKQMIKQKSTTRDCGRKSCSNYSLKIEMFIVWACLFALVWGKVLAIVICTSSWLFFAPAYRRRRSHRPQPRKFDSFDAIDPEYKKQVIMEGLLDRNR